MDLLEHSIHCRGWPEGLRAARVKAFDGNNGLQFENSALACQAAIGELGIVMAQRAFNGGGPARWTARAPLAAEGAHHDGYFLAYPKARSQSPIIRAFENWITSETAQMEEAVLAWAKRAV